MAFSSGESRLLFAACVLALCQASMVISYTLRADKFSNVSRSASEYMSEREKLIGKDTLSRTGQKIVLNDVEKKANNILMGWKKKELDIADKTENDICAQSFITAKEKIEQSKVFKIIRKMPKGAVLHLHDLSMASYKWLIQNITTLSTCYMCFNVQKQIMEFKISLENPTQTKNCEWISVPLARKRSMNATKFDAELFSNFTMTDGDPTLIYHGQKQIWEKFGNIFLTLSGLIGFDQAFAGYYAKGLEELFEDNIQYSEIRALLIPVYDIAGSTYSDPEHTLNIYKSITEQFLASHSKDFFGSRIIYIAPRSANATSIGQAVNKAIYLRKKYPDLLAGFDLVGQEDAGHSLLYFLKQLLVPENVGADLPYFFHAGETNWEGQSVDYNIADALLLKTKRIGHGFAFVKHPELMKLAVQNKVPVEVCPISNQVLGLVDDLRNHPASSFLSEDFPMTVNSDDPAIWGATGLSYDFYEVFMGMTLADDDLRVLKQLALNSIKYCSLEADKKANLLAMWQAKWDLFIQQIVNEFPLPAENG